MGVSGEARRGIEGDRPDAREGRIFGRKTFDGEPGPGEVQVGGRGCTTQGADGGEADGEGAGVRGVSRFYQSTPRWDSTHLRSPAGGEGKVSAAIILLFVAVVILVRDVV